MARAPTPHNTQEFSSRLAAIQEKLSPAVLEERMQDGKEKVSTQSEAYGEFIRVTGFNLSLTEQLAVTKVLEGQAVDLARKSTTSASSHCCLISACYVLAFGGVPTHVISFDDARAETKFHDFAAVAEKLGIKTALVTAITSSASRKAAYAADVVFVSARERALDYLRDHHATKRRNHIASTQLQFLRRLSFKAGDDEAAKVNNALVFALIDDIDLILSEGAMTPVHLYDDGVTATGSETQSTDESIVSASNFFRVFSTYGRLGGFGAQLDTSTAKIFSHYPVSQSRLDGLENALESFTTPQTENVRCQLHVMSKSHGYASQVVELVKHLQGNKAKTSLTGRVILDRVPMKDLPELEAALKIANPDVVIGDAVFLQSQIKTLPPGGCLLLPFSLSRIPNSIVNEGESRQGQFEVCSLGFEESFRAELRKRVCLKTMIEDWRFHILLTDSYQELALSSGVTRCINWLPGVVKKIILGALIRHKQKEFDRHRSRTLKAMIKYEEELDDLLAFSG